MFSNKQCKARRPRLGLAIFARWCYSTALHRFVDLVMWILDRFGPKCNDMIQEPLTINFDSFNFHHDSCNRFPTFLQTNARVPISRQLLPCEIISYYFKNLSEPYDDHLKDYCGQWMGVINLNTVALVWHCEHNISILRWIACHGTLFFVNLRKTVSPPNLKNNLPLNRYLFVALCIKHSLKT